MPVISVRRPSAELSAIEKTSSIWTANEIDRQVECQVECVASCAPPNMWLHNSNRYPNSDDNPVHPPCQYPVDKSVSKRSIGFVEERCRGVEEATNDCESGEVNRDLPFAGLPICLFHLLSHKHKNGKCVKLCNSDPSLPSMNRSRSLLHCNRNLTGTREATSQSRLLGSR